MPQIHLDKEHLNKEIFADVLFITFSAPSAMGNGGLVQFITRDGTEYFFNFIEDELKCSHVEEIFPPLKLFRRDSSPLEDWHLIYLGIGASMAIKDEVFPTFKQIAQEYPATNYMLFQNWRKIVLQTLKSNKTVLLGTVKGSIINLSGDTTYSFDIINKQIIKTKKDNSTVISEPMFFMELDEHYTFKQGNRIIDETAKEIAEKYLSLKNGTTTPYSRATLIFECFNGNFVIVSQFGQLILRWYGKPNDNNRQKEAVVLVEQLEQSFTKWDVKKYEQVIRNEIARKDIREDEFNNHLSGIYLPKAMQDMSFNIVLKEDGELLPDGRVLESFCLYKKKDDIVKIFWSVGFGYSIQGHNPGVGGKDIVPADYFINHNLSAFATYISSRYKEFITYKEVYYNSEIKALFDLLSVQD